VFGSAVLGVCLLLGTLAGTARSQAEPQKGPDPKKPAPASTEGDATPPKPDAESKEETPPTDPDQPEEMDDQKSSSEDDKEALPPGVFVPPPRPAEFTINDPKTTDEQWKKWGKGGGRGDFATRVQNGDHDGQSDKVVQDGIREQLAAMTLASMRDPKAEHFVVSEIVQQLLRYVRTAASKKPPGDQRQYRIFMMQEIIKDCRELQLASNQYYVRLNATVLLAHMFIKEADAATKTDPEFYTPAFDALMEVLEKENQSEAVKIIAVNGLQNACLYGNPALQVNENVRLATRLIAELEKPGANEWYQERLCDALGSVDQPHDFTGKPFIAQALGKVLFDSGRPLCVRAAAARALGRAPLDPSVDLKVIAYGIADLSRQMVEARNAGSPRMHVRRWCIAYIFLAFQPRNSAEKARRAGLLDRVEEPNFVKYKQPVVQVWGIIRPIIVEELRHRSESRVEFPAEMLTPIAKWLKENAPAALRISPDMPPLTTTQVTKVDANGHK
jgi:hypothetical protein